MKTFITAVVYFLMTLSLTAGGGKYEKAMKKHLAKIDSAREVASILEVANGFERIAYAEKERWLPYYYTSFMYTLASFSDSTTEKKDGYLDKADMFINIADSLEEMESEIYVLKGMIAQARLQVDPMNRWMTYGAASTANLQKAIELDTLNPRPEYLMGISLYYTPEQFGGGPKTAKPLLEKSLEKFNQFEPKNELMPNWGRERVEQLLEKINAEAEELNEVQEETNEIQEEIKEE